jgi:hypothetical protein
LTSEGIEKRFDAHEQVTGLSLLYFSCSISCIFSGIFPTGALMTTATQQATRLEKDSIGPKEIPANVYYGIQTARAVENYPISGMRAHPTLIAAFGMVKEAAAAANKELKLVDDKRADAIIRAAKEVQEGNGTRNLWWTCFRQAPGSAFT